MADIAQLGLEIQTGDVTRARRELDGLTAAGGRAEGMAGRLAGGFSAVGRVAGGLAAAAGTVALLGRQALLTADAYTSLAGRLALVTGSGERLLRTQQALFEQAQRTRVDVAATTDLYGSLARSTQALGISQDRLLRVTESINQALIVSGASGASAQAALIQLGQGFASGVIRGEELNSILEQTPRLAQAIADGLGVPLGQLRKLGQEGKLTAEAVFGALERAGAGLAAEFGKMPVTIAQATTQVENSVGNLIATVDRLTGTSSAIAKWVSDASANLDGLAASIQRNGSVFGGLIDNLNQGFAGAASRRFSAELAKEVTRLERLRKRLDAGGGGPLLEELIRRSEARIEDLTKKAQAANTELKTLAGIASAAPDLSQDSAEMAKFLRQGRRDTAAPDAPKPGRDRFAEELAARRERISLIGLESEVERTAAQIAVGSYGKLTDVQRSQLLALAAAEDARNAENLALSRGIAERAKLSAVTEALARQQQGEVQSLTQSNQALREEIEVIGATEAAKTAIEQARVRSQRVMLEEAAAQLVLKGATEDDLVVMREQIALLREREQLIGQRGQRRQEVDAQQDGERLAEQLARDTRQDVTQALQAAFRDTSGNPVKAFADAVGNALFTRVTARLADAMATSLVGADGAGGLIGSLGSAFGSYFGSPNFVGPPEIAAGRAFGGPVRAGSLVPVNEMGTEMLTMGGRDYLMAGANGYVTPAGKGQQGGRSVVINSSPTITISGGGDTAALRVEFAQALQERDRQLMRMLSEEGVI